MTILTTQDQIAFWREHATGPSVTHAIIQQLLDDHETMKAALRESQDNADAQRMLAENYMEAFASKPDQQLADGLEEYIALLQEELKSARAMTEEASRIIREFLTWWREKGKRESSAYGAPGSIFSMDAFVEKSRAYLQAHPESEGKGK